MPTPRAALELLERAPHLVLLEDERGDMFSSELWGAVFGPQGDDGFSPYRYLLWRVFDPSLPLLIVLMLNPSRATHLDGDRTVDGLIRRARSMGYGGILVVNCFAWRATDPADMKRALDPVGPDNDLTLATVLSQNADLLCAWGVNASHAGREKRVRWLISEGRARPHWLRLCAGGAPEHPLYLPSALTLTPWPDMPQLG